MNLFEGKCAEMSYEECRRLVQTVRQNGHALQTVIRDIATQNPSGLRYAESTMKGIPLSDARLEILGVTRQAYDDAAAIERAGVSLPPRVVVGV